ncbi:diguanylate cyclase [Sinorhizobium meliloti]|nr:diguanylate cyclase [Sinorhizobium meliloti]MDW9976827.1 diguanylate cyclase [Sinorhizobium meliloti]MDX0293549.1 diguanylate cyclase [Sinorhizobium meliloti]
MRVPSNPLILIGPTILLLFAATFVWIWMIDRRRKHLLYYGGGALLFCIGAMSQIFAIPEGAGPNAVVSAFIYVSSVLVLCDGLLRRSGRGLHWAEYVASIILIVGGIAYFFYIDRQLITRIYLLNFGIGVICLASTLRLRGLRYGKAAERVLFWVLLAFSIHFFLRTTLTVGLVAPSATSFASSPFWLALQYSVAVLGVALALAIVQVTVSDTLDELRRERALDPLTGLLNRRGFEEFATVRLQAPHAWPISLLVVDIDHFKKVNDTHGHLAGDAVLKTFGQLMLATARQVDVCGRLGGEEFLILMPNCDLEGARIVAERLRTSVGTAVFDGLPKEWRVTASVGIAEIRRGEALLELIARADEALYEAKRSGRDRVNAYRQAIAGV